MIVFKYTLTGPISEEYSLGQKLADCGAIVFFESKETSTFGVGIPNSAQAQVLSCLQHKLNQQEYAKIEHAIADYELRVNYYLDALAEQGFPKIDENGKLNEDTLKTAEWLVFNEVVGGEYGELWDMLTKMGMNPYYTGFENKETIDAVRSLEDEIYQYEGIVKGYMDKKLSREEIIKELAKELKKNKDGSPKINWEQVAEYTLDKILAEPSNKYNKLIRKFKEEYSKMSDEEREAFDEWFIEQVEPAILEEFYGGYHPTGKGADLKMKSFVDYIYMYMIANHKMELDERYDQPLFAEAEEYAESSVRG
jgi:hypothetical protein